MNFMNMRTHLHNEKGYMVGGKTKPFPYMKITWNNTKVGTGWKKYI